ncbi:hypothetical protein IHQ68_12865 [Chelatococcus sambhunathii]|uniref:Uncharacterized protein n=1 Tax=Chelatococcus sambhunathii TaxID=363953 RepID=A0ABU1DH98_9HYPH|nr:hypothetical protein [Chelatococcus sambhunathii]MDR4307508.1 hypothetical protein [Chelatococcus sambhunathii]
MSDSGVTEEPSAEIVEAFAKQLFRSESAADVLWDTALFERMGRSTEGLKVADEALKDDYRRRAHEMLLDPKP